MRPNEAGGEELAAYAQANGMTILSAQEGLAVVRLKNGSISNITNRTVSDWVNRNTIQEMGDKGNIQHAAFSQSDNAIDNHAAKKLHEIGIDSNIKSTAELTDDLRARAIAAGISGHELSQLISTRNIQAAKREQDNYFADKQLKEFESKMNNPNHSIREDNREAELRASHGLSSTQPTQDFSRKPSEPVNGL